MENHTYKEIQYFKTIIVLFSLCMVVFCIIYFNEWGDPRKLLSPSSLVMILLLCSIVIALFFRLVIKISGNKLSISFGLGMIKKSWNIENIQKETISTKRIPLYYGMGIRLTPHGTLYNTSPGHAVKFVVKGNNRKYMIGTRNSKKLMELLKLRN